MRTALTAVLLSAFVATTVGCSIDTAIKGRATKTGPVTLFDPCTLPDEALHAIGVDPATESPDFMGVQSEGWEVCDWEADWYYISVFTTDVTVEEFRERPRTADFRAVDVGGRNAHTFRSTAESQRGLCDLVYPTAQGTVLIRVDTKADEQIREDPCTVVLRAAITLDTHIPD
ncbi:DUF3558 family protein [Rhodococcus sp. O3]|uniref:DUF3558 family protein n=1 Tax=Rhodococcus sp. O3 TaxID=3404919 RepID=UPI003B674E81